MCFECAEKWKVVKKQKKNVRYGLNPSLISCEDFCRKSYSAKIFNLKDGHLYDGKKQVVKEGDRHSETISNIEK